MQQEGKNMSVALIGYSGFVGSTLDNALQPSDRFRSTNTEEMIGKHFEHVICAGVQAKKWWANQNPDEDMAGIQKLLDVLATVTADRFTLISTIDVYPCPRTVDEETQIEKTGHHPYGLHRLLVEEWIKRNFESHCIMRLPGLFGPGLKKNVIFDLMYDNNLENVHPDGVFQYYDTRLLADDIAKAWDSGISLLNISSEPIPTREIRDAFFPRKNLGATGAAPPGYDMRSKFAQAWHGSNGYLYSKQSIFNHLQNYLDTPY